MLTPISISSPVRDELPKDSSEAQFKMYEHEMNKRILDMHLNGGKEIDVLGKKMFTVRSNLGQSIAWIKNDLVVYLVAYTFESTYWGKVLVQNLVWSDPANVPKGFARKIMFSYLLDKYKILRTSETQRDFGIRMWYTFTLDALSRKLYVYVTNIGDVDLSQIHTVKQLRNLYNDIWGTDPIHKTRHVLISKSPLI